MKLYDLKVKDATGKEVSLSDYKGKVLMIVNTATGCGFTPQYEGLEKVYEKFKDQGFEVLDFPCNQFLEQAPGSNDEIVSFCKLNYNTQFTTFGKIDVNGDNADALYKFLKAEQPEDAVNSGTAAFLEKLKELNQMREGSDIKWNFTKFLVDREGNIISRYAPNVTPEELERKITKLLG